MKINIINKLLYELDINGSDFAKMLGVSRQTISLYRKGNRGPSKKRMTAISKIAKEHGIKLTLDDLKSIRQCKQEILKKS